MTRPATMPTWARGALSAFDWAKDAERLWPTLHRKTRELVLAAARAEVAASRAYNRADSALERAIQADQRRMLANLRFT